MKESGASKRDKCQWSKKEGQNKSTHIYLYSQLTTTKAPGTYHKERRVSSMGLEKADVPVETKGFKARDQVTGNLLTKERKPNDFLKIYTEKIDNKHKNKPVI